jgi:hypothetical protein
MINEEEKYTHSEIINRVSSWASKFNVSEDPIYKSLIQDLKDEENLAIWASMDPFEYLPQPNPTASKRFLTVSRALSNLRNVLVFVPVALTWEAVSRATKAFALFIQTNNATTVNFLEFWQNGYDVLDSFWTISHIASLDFAIIMVIIAMTLLSGFLASKGNKVDERESAVIDSERLDLALTLKMYLYSMREIDKNNIVDGVAQSVSTLLTASANLSKTSKQLTTIFDELKAGVPIISDFGDQMGRESKKLSNQVSSLNAALVDIEGSLTGELRDAISAATVGLDLASTELDKSTQSIRSNSIAAENEIKVLQKFIKKASRSRS